ncbi:ParB/RepB/Spo0J family partition protein [Actinomyces trachealis]|uniref:ParB/RepB/Spo0J family partition protein n=1 Tax=Actinomyces trachealis TaxID=2763540 RepID=UPI001892CA5C|nr:ParB/RepB/Spo0J family partition protein [Actinomyces trachealis]
MAERRRALGRGLEALMPSAQAEPIGRPSDVFFPEDSRRDVEDKKAATKATQAEEGARNQSGSRSTSDLAAKLLAPSKRTTKHGRKAPARAAKAPAVSRETEQEDAQLAAAPVVEPPDSANSAVAEETDDASSEQLAGVQVDTPAVSRETKLESEPLVPVPGATFGHIPLDQIDANPRQPRQYFDDEDIEELAASIREVGLLQPIVVRRSLDGDDAKPHYELIMGERRTRAARVAGLETIPAIVRYTDDQDLLRDALLENLHRVQLNPLEEAAAYKALLEDFGCTHAELSKRIARSRSQISNTLRLLRLPALVQRRVAAGVLSAGHARALLGLPDAGSMERLAQKIVAEGLSVRAAEELVAMHEEPEDVAPAARPQRVRSMPLPALSTRLSDAFETRVKVTRSAKKGKITIEFAGDEDLARIVDALAPGTSLAED